MWEITVGLSEVSSLPHRFVVGKDFDEIRAIGALVDLCFPYPVFDPDVGHIGTFSWCIDKIVEVSDLMKEDPSPLVVLPQVVLDRRIFLIRSIMPFRDRYNRHSA